MCARARVSVSVCLCVYDCVCLCGHARVCLMRSSLAFHFLGSPPKAPQTQQRPGRQDSPAVDLLTLKGGDMQDGVPGEFPPGLLALGQRKRLLFSHEARSDSRTKRQCGTKAP